MLLSIFKLMESTGKYWIPIFNYLEKDIDVCLTHPKYVKAIKGKKTNKKDSKWIADLYKFDLVRCSFIPPKDFRRLREIAGYRFKLVCMKSSEKNRIQNCMTVFNIGIASVLKDPFCKTATEIMSYLLKHTSDTMDEKTVRKLIRKGTKATSSEIIEALKGYSIEADQAKKPELARRHLEYLEDMITQTEVELYVRMMMVCIYHMISEKKPFAPTDYEELMDSREQKKRVVLNEENALAFLAAQGYDTSQLVKCNDN